MSPRSAGRKRPKLVERLLVKPGSSVHLGDADASDTFGHDKSTAEAATASDLERLTSLQERIRAEGQRAVLIVLQGIDTAGKDGTIRHVMQAFNPQGCRVTSFDIPTALEARHDHLWRIHAAVPGKGEVGIFNRSQYESVLVVRVHELVPEATWRRYYDEINEFEAILANAGTTVLKFFLHISRAEQLDRLKARYDDPTKQWKFQAGDLAERARWDDYMAAYQEALSRCSTDTAPWYRIPSDHKWFRNLAIGEIVADRFEALHPAYPKVDLPKDLLLR
ncbi:MAG TPA: PPK2 family polyphosphate kinase [Candidatus Limnocylindrales bacterium]|nr:PPK2 family polyphosphate kinase [Candidatus Limnocylindrales bacterium]